MYFTPRVLYIRHDNAPVAPSSTNTYNEGKLNFRTRMECGDHPKSRLRLPFQGGTARKRDEQPDTEENNDSAH
mgnify:CR=1 FL=1